jgi:hypothetical protein
MKFNKTFFAVTFFLLAAVQARAVEDLSLYQQGDDYFFQGEGKANPKIASQTRRRTLSMQAAVLDAQMKMARMVYGRRPDGYAKLESAAEKDKRVRYFVSAFIKGSQVVETQWDDDDSCAAIVKISRKNLFGKPPKSAGRKQKQD